jgi:hypothetical protein
VEDGQWDTTKRKKKRDQKAGRRVTIIKPGSPRQCISIFSQEFSRTTAVDESANCIPKTNGTRQGKNKESENESVKTTNQSERKKGGPQTRRSAIFVWQKGVVWEAIKSKD